MTFPSIAYTLTASRHFHTQLPYLIPLIDNCVDDRELQYRVVTFESIYSALDAAYSLSYYLEEPMVVHRARWKVCTRFFSGKLPAQTPLEKL